VTATRYGYFPDFHVRQVLPRVREW
jgi:hypothetical protein